MLPLASVVTSKGICRLGVLVVNTCREPEDTEGLPTTAEPVDDTAAGVPVIFTTRLLLESATQRALEASTQMPFG